MKSPMKKRVCVALTGADYQQLSRLALESGRTRSGYLRWLLHLHLKNQDKPRD